MKYPPKIRTAKKGWRAVVPYKFTEFIELSQKASGELVDILAVVSKVGSVLDKQITKSGSTYTLTTRDIVVNSGTFHETLQLIGEYTKLNLQAGTTIAVRGARISEWNQVRSLSTGYLTRIEVDPIKGPCMFNLPSFDAASPSKKAAGLKTMAVVYSGEVTRMKSSLANNAGISSDGSLSKPTDVCIIAKLHKYDNDVFTRPIFYGTDENPLVKLPAVLYDDSGTLRDVTMWDMPCRLIFQFVGATLHGMWEVCVEGDEEKETFLDLLNEHAQKDIRFYLSLKTWKPADRPDCILVQVHVNAADPNNVQTSM